MLFDVLRLKKKLNKNIFPGLCNFKIGPGHCLTTIQVLYSSKENIPLNTASEFSKYAPFYLSNINSLARISLSI